MFRVLPHSIVFLCGCLLCLFAVSLAWRRRDKPGGWLFVGLMLSSGVWTGSAAVEAAVVGQGVKILWSQIEYIGLVFIGVFLLFFALAYTRQAGLLSRETRVLLWAIPVISLALVWTNEWHHLQWTGFSVGDARANILVYHRGPVFWFIIGYTYVFSALAYAVFANACRTTKGAIRRQYLAVMLGGLFPLATGAVYLCGQDWVRGMDVSPLGFSVAGLMIAWGLFRFRLLDLVPVGRAVLVERVPDGVVVFDEKGRLVDINPAACRMLDVGAEGLCADDLKERHPGWSALLAAKTESKIEIALKSGELEVGVRIVPLFGRHGHLQGRLFILHDYTELMAATRERERVIAELNQALTQIKTLRNLLPICCSCKKIRNDEGYWQQIESYIREHAGIEFSHSLCPECEQKIYSDTLPPHEDSKDTMA